jgi:signal transduction histidine kinase
VIHSIRWRLVLSYIAITLVTVTALGLLGYSLAAKNISAAEMANLESNAQVIAAQALPLVQPTLRVDELDDLARSSGYLADLRVRILSPTGSVMVDSGRPRDMDRLFWISGARGQDVGPERDAGMLLLDSVFVTIPHAEGGDPSARAELSQALRQTIGANVDIHEYTRRTSLWGPRLTIVEPSAGLAPTLAAEPRSSQTVRIAIGDSRNPAGYVQVSESPSLREEALRTTYQPFVVAASGAVLLAGLIGLLIGHRMSGPIIALSRSAEQMGAGDLSVRVSTIGKGEIGQLGEQFNRMADRLQASFEQLEAERDTLRRFIADASHELRTPVTALRSFLELLQTKANRNAKTRAEFLGESMRQVERLEWITSNLLNLSRLDAGITLLSTEEVGVPDLLSAVGAAFKAKAKEKRLRLVQQAAREDLVLHVDRTLVEMALSNLIDNAVKFTPAGGEVAFGASLVEDRIQLWVRDTGEGIGPDDLPHVFERFYRGRGQEAEGSGLGLALVKSVVEAHGGEVRVESAVGVGSQFVMEFPGGGSPSQPAV